MSVPWCSGENVLFIQTGMFFLMTGCIVGGYTTLAPKCESSMASRYNTFGIILALETSLGSAVIIPLTSVHISSALASSAAAMMAAVKSEPPLPNVVVIPFWSDAINPGTRKKEWPFSVNADSILGLEISKFTIACSKFELVIITFLASIHLFFSPIDSNFAEII